MAGSLTRAPATEPTFGTRALDHGWRWRDRRGEMHAPADMVTRHLFHTFRMIWNNHMPEEAWVGDVRLYTFPPVYTREYLSDAVVALGRELTGRTDLTPDQRRQLAQMAAWFAKFEVSRPARIERPQHRLSARKAT